jgi:hypothetical protein|tara:strand:- start:441 stop:722 length:282 start_codon:yes stop_codon:yes gene_type:complete
LKFLRAPVDLWVSVVRSTWRAFLIFGGLVLAAVIVQLYRGDFADKRYDEIVDDVAIAAVLMFGVSFLTSLIFHFQVWRNRNRKWPGGGGPKTG